MRRQTQCCLTFQISKPTEASGDSFECFPGTVCQPITDPSLLWIAWLRRLRGLTVIPWNHWEMEWWRRESVVSACIRQTCYTMKIIVGELEPWDWSGAGKRTEVHYHRMSFNQRTFYATKMIGGKSETLSQREAQYWNHSP